MSGIWEVKSVLGGDCSKIDSRSEYLVICVLIGC